MDDRVWLRDIWPHVSHFQETKASRRHYDLEDTIVHDRSTLGVKLMTDAKYSGVTCLVNGTEDHSVPAINGGPHSSKFCAIRGFNCQ